MGTLCKTTPNFETIQRFGSQSLVLTESLKMWFLNKLHICYFCKEWKIHVNQSLGINYSNYVKGFERDFIMIWTFYRNFNISRWRVFLKNCFFFKSFFIPSCLHNPDLSIKPKKFTPVLKMWKSTRSSKCSEGFQISSPTYVPFKFWRTKNSTFWRKISSALFCVRIAKPGKRIFVIERLHRPDRGVRFALKWRYPRLPEAAVRR